MPTDPRMVASASPPRAAPASSAALNNVFVALVDLSRRIDGLEAARTVINPASLDGTQLAPDSVTASHIVAGSIHASEIETGNIVASIMTVGAVNASHIDASSIRTAVLSANSITTAMIQAGAVTTATLAAGAVTTATLAAGAVTTTTLAASAVTTAKLDANAITGLNISLTTGGVFRTGNSPNARVEIDATGLRGYNLSNQQVIGIDTATGVATFAGVVQSGATVPVSTLQGFIGGGNMVPDSSFESTDPALPNGLWAVNGTTQAKSSTQSFHGSKALAVTYASGTLAFTAHTPAADVLSAIKGRPVVFSAWVYVPSAVGAFVAGAIDTAIQFFDGTTTTNGTAITAIPRDTWTRVVVKATVASAATFVRLRLCNPYTTGGAVYYDGIQLELGDAATAYAPKPDEIVYGSITSTHIAAGTIQTSNLAATAINGMTITGALFQNTAADPAVRFDSSGFYTTDATVTKLIQITAAGGVLIATGAGSNRSVQWVRSDATVSGEIYSTPGVTSNDGGMHITSKAKATGKSSVYLAAEVAPGGSSVAVVDLFAGESVETDNKVVLILQNLPGGTVVPNITLIDGQQRSSYLQIVGGPLKRMFNAGTDTCTFTASGFSATKVVTHNLGATPISINLTPEHASGITPLTAVVEAKTSTTFTVRMYANPSTTNTTGTWTFHWQAIA